MKHIFPLILLVVMLCTFVACSIDNNAYLSRYEETELGEPIAGAQIEVLMDGIAKSGDLTNYTVTIDSQLNITIGDATFKNDGNGLYTATIKEYSLGSSYASELPADVTYYDMNNNVAYIVDYDKIHKVDVESIGELSLRDAINTILGAHFYDEMTAAIVDCRYNADDHTYILKDFSYTKNGTTIKCGSVTLTVDSNGQLSSFTCQNNTCTIHISISELGNTTVILPE